MQRITRAGQKFNPKTDVYSMGKKRDDQYMLQQSMVLPKELKAASFALYLTLTPTSRFERSKEDKWEVTARKDPISLANHGG